MSRSVVDRADVAISFARAALHGGQRSRSVVDRADVAMFHHPLGWNRESGLDLLSIEQTLRYPNALLARSR